jgi:hypothetical protein
MVRTYRLDLFTLETWQELIAQSQRSRFPVPDDPWHGLLTVPRTDARPVSVVICFDPLIPLSTLTPTKCSQINYFSRFGRVVSLLGEAVTV